MAACFLPLADHLGYELAEIIALLAGMLAAVPGVSAARRFPGQPWSALRRGLGAALLALLIPLAVILLNGLRRPVCDPLAGLVLYGALAVPSALLSASLGLACGALAPRRAGLCVALVFAGSLAVALWPVLRGPQVFVFHHLGGMYPGPIYDEAIRASPALWLFRLCTLLYALACCALSFGRRGAWLALLCGVPALGLSLNAERLHWKASVPLIDAALGGRLETEHLLLHFPREKREEEQKLMARDAEASFGEVRGFFGAGGQGGRIDVFLYRSADEKRTLIGAAETSFTKPWLRQIHTNDQAAPHSILRHELVHAVGADLAHGPWGVPGGLFPDMALIEGAAEAGDWPPGEFTPHEEARALRELKLLPDLRELFTPGRFYNESGPRAYTAAGSFVRWLWETRGAKSIVDIYSGKTALDVAALLPQYLAFLDALSEPGRAVALAQQRFFAPAIVRKPCAHEVAQLGRDAGAAAQRGDSAAAQALWARCAALEPDDPGLLHQLWRAQLSAGNPAARETQARLLAHLKLSKPLRAQVLTEAGDAAWKAGNLAEAQARFEEAAHLPQPEAAERALTLRLRSLRDPLLSAALRPLLAEGNTGPEVLLALRDVDLARPRDGAAAYLLAKQLQNRGAWKECLRYAADALSRELPGPAFTQEAQRMRGIAAWHLGDAQTARAAFSALGRPRETQLWLDRL